MEQLNQLRMLVKTDSDPIQQIANEVNLHPNTITRLINPHGIPLVGKRQLASAKKLAARYGMDVNIVITLEPIEESGNGN